MYSKEDLKEEFAKAKAKDQSGKREVYTARAAMMKKHMEEERDMPELYENLISRQTGLPAFNFLDYMRHIHPIIQKNIFG